jgi:hypothetical protein
VTELPAAGDGLVEIPLSALEHYAYCHRQAALIHLEGVWSDSGDTVRGELSHRAVDLPGLTRRAGVTVVRALPVWSEAYALRGICDVVEIAGIPPYRWSTRSGITCLEDRLTSKLPVKRFASMGLDTTLRSAASTQWPNVGAMSLR